MGGDDASPKRVTAAGRIGEAMRIFLCVLSANSTAKFRVQVNLIAGSGFLEHFWIVQTMKPREIDGFGIVKMGNKM